MGEIKGWERLLFNIRLFLYRWSPIWISYGAIDAFGVGVNYVVVAVRTSRRSFRLFIRTPWYSKFAKWRWETYGIVPEPFFWDVYLATSKRDEAFYRTIQLIGRS